MPVTYKKIASVTVGTSAPTSIDFTSIPGTYTDLVILFSGRISAAANIGTVILTFNGSATGYSDRVVSGDGSSVASTTDTSIRIRTNGANATASTFGNAFIYIPNYAGSTNKSVSSDAVSENNATQASTSLGAGLWSDTAAITSLKLETVSAQTYAQYSTAVLYGISKS